MQRRPVGGIHEVFGDMRMEFNAVKHSSAVPVSLVAYLEEHVDTYMNSL